MSIKESGFNKLDNQLKSELALIKKYNLYSTICANEQLKAEFEQVCSEHKSNYNTLLNKLN